MSRIPHLSASSLDLYKQCPRKFYFSKILHLPTKPVGFEALAGTFAHSTLETFLGLPPEERTKEKLSLIVKEQWPEFTKSDEYVTMEVTDLTFKETVNKGLVGYLSMEDPVKVEVYERELEINCMVDGVPLHGFIDRITRHDDCYVVGDFKTGRVPAEKYREDKLIQPLLYAAALQTMGLEVCKVELLYVTYGDIIGCVVSDDRIDAVKGLLRKAWDEINDPDNEFPEKTGPLCAWCDFESICPKGKKAADNYRKFRAYKGNPIS